MKVLLFKGRGVMSALIRWQTRSQYSHAAILLDDGKTSIESWQGSGVRVKEITDWSNIDTFEIVGLSETQKEEVVDFLDDQVGCGYDYLAVLRFVSRRHTASNTRWFCSELVFAALEQAGIKLLERVPAAEVSPGMLALSPFLK